MRNLTTYGLCVIGLLAALCLTWENGTIIEKNESRIENNNHIYIISYKVLRYEREKTETDSRINIENPKTNWDVQPRSRGFDFWNWLNRE